MSGITSCSSSNDVAAWAAGRYSLTKTAFVQSTSVIDKCVDPKSLQQIPAGTVIDILEVVPIYDQNRLRGRLGSPQGWVTLKALDDTLVWACPDAAPSHLPSSSIDTVLKPKEIANGEGPAGSWGLFPPELLSRMLGFAEHPHEICCFEASSQHMRHLVLDQSNDAWQEMCGRWYPSMEAKLRQAEVEEPSVETLNWRYKFAVRFLRQGAWNAEAQKKQNHREARKNRAEKERHEARSWDAEHNEGARAPRTKTCRRCQTSYLPKDNDDISCAWHSGDFVVYAGDSELSRWNHSQVQQRLKVQSKKGGNSRVLGTNWGRLMTPQQWSKLIPKKTDLSQTSAAWACCGGRFVDSPGCVRGAHC